MITAEENFGKRLARAREAKGLSVEEAARGTRMRPAYIQALESSNLSRFPNAAYAKSFLQMYGKYLGVEIKEVADTIDTTTQVGVHDFQYLSSRAEDDKVAQKAAGDARYDFVVPQRESRSWLPLIIGAAVIAIGGLTFVVSMNLTRIEDKPDAKAEAAANSTAKPPVPVIKPTPEAQAASTPGNPTLTAQTARTPQAPQPAPTAGQVAPGAPTVQTPPGPAVAAPRPTVVATPPGSSPAAVPVERDPNVPKARPISPVASIAADDSAALASIPVPAKPVATPGAGTPPAAPPPAAASVPTRSELSVSRDEADVVLLQPRRKTWVVIRNGPGGQPIYEDYLYPSARPMRLPAGKYYIELKEADAVSIVRNGKPISYVAGGVMVQ